MNYFSTKLKWLLTILAISGSALDFLCWTSFFSTGKDFTEIVPGLQGKTTWGLFFRSAGACIGSLTGLLLYNYDPKEVMYALCLMLMGLGSILIPQVHDFWAHSGLSFLVGVSVGLAAVGAYLIIICLWRKNSGPFLQTLTFVGTIASTITPLIFEPFLSREIDSFDHHQNVQRPNYTNKNNQSLTSHIDAGMRQINYPNASQILETQIWIPYMASGLTTLIFGLFVLVVGVYLKWRRIEVYLRPEEIHTKPFVLDDGHHVDNAITVLGCLLFFIFFGFTDVTWQTWIIFVESTQLALDKVYAVRMIFVMNLCYALTNFLCIFVSMKLKPFAILFALTLLIFIGNLLHLFFASTSIVLLWIGALCQSMGFASFAASTFAFLETTLSGGVNNTVTSLLTCSSWLANACGFSLIIGHFIEKHPIALIYTNLVSISFIAIILTGMLMLSRLKRKTQKFKATIELSAKA